MIKNKLFSRTVACLLATAMCIGMIPSTIYAADVDTTVSGNYYNVISNKEYALAPGATETEIVVNNAGGSDRKVVHVFEVDTQNENIEVLPGYYGIDKLNPDDLAGDGPSGRNVWTAKELTKTVEYYEDQLGYNVVGAMNTALAYDSNAPYGYMVWDGVVLGTPEVHKGAQTYLAIDKDGTCELRSMSTPLDGDEWTAISANFGWLVKDGVLSSKTVERTSSDASRSMIGIKADGTLVFCQVDGRNAPVSTGLSNYEMGEMMLSLGCVNAVNCDGGGSSTFVSKREGETENTMRSVPSDGSERPTINSVILVSKAKATGEFDHAVLNSDYEYYAPGTSATVNVKGVDAAGSPAEVPVNGITWVLSDASFGSVSDGIFTSNGTKGDVTVQMLYNGEIVGEKQIHIVDPDTFSLELDDTVLPYGKSMTIDFACTYGSDNWAVCVDGAYSLTLSDENAALLEGNKLTAANDESMAGVTVTATYLPNPAMTDTLNVSFGKGSEVVFDFEDGDISDFLGVDEMYDWAEETGAAAPIQNDGNYSDNTDSETFLATTDNGGKVRKGEKALGVTLDYTDATFASWSYNMFFYTGESVVLRDVANGKNATTLGMWVYIPEGAAGLAMQIQGIKNPNGTGGTGAHFYFTTASGVKKNLNSCTEADIPESRWVYATVDLTAFGDYFATYPPMGTNGREPSFIRFYVKPTVPAKLDFYFDDITLDYSSAVEDRVLPAITDITYATADTGVALENGAKISGNTMAFSANIADNSALDTTTGKILVDGVEIENVTVSGKNMSCGDVTLLAGEHTVTFEVCDKLGNLAKVTRTFTVEGEEQITLGGHNESGKLAEYDSIYYIDINARDMAAVNKLTATLKLQTANTWETEGAIIAEGYDAVFDYNEISRLLTVTVEKNANVTAVSDTEGTLVSIPVRLWSWDGVNHVTDTVITPEEQFKSGYCPIVKINCEVEKGVVELAESTELGAFGGTFTTDTKLNDNVNPWHYHDAELTTLNKEATCLESGYTDRTYCETCESVVGWGEKVKGGHLYEVAGEELKCACGEVMIGSGVVETNGKLYYLISDKVVTGWQAVETEWCYADPATKELAVGKQTIQGVTYTFDENGVLIKGAWITDSTGKKYSYGPDFYKRSWKEIDGNKYYFGTDGYVYTGIRSIPVNRNNLKEGVYWYEFAEDGVYIREMSDFTGILEENGCKYYVKDGANYYGGLMLIDGNYYYARTYGELVCDKEYWITKTNDLLPEGYYTFDAEGKMINAPVAEPEKPEEPEVKNGIYADDSGKLWYYENDVKTYGGLLLVEGNYYYARTSGEIVCNREYWITKTNDLLPEAYYTFDTDGKMVNAPVAEPEKPEEPEVPEQPEVKNGICADENGKLWYFENDVKAYGGLLLVEGNYYYARTSGEIVCNREYWITKTNDLLPEGYYTFDTEGKMVNAPAAVQ